MAKTHVRPTSKGQVTLPIAIRRQLKVTPETILEVTAEDEQIVLRPVRLTTGRLYDAGEIDQFLRDDQISAADARFFKRILKD